MDLSLLINQIPTVIMGGVALVILRSELRLRSKLYKRELDIREKQQNWLESQQTTLEEMALSLSEKIASELRQDSRWAAEALERSMLGPYSDTLFGERKNHFRDEKERIAERFVPILLKRLKHLIESSRNNSPKKVFLCIDSGTTLYPFFRNIGIEMAGAYNQGENWVQSLTIVTNNLPGIEALMEHGRINPADRFSSLAVKCKLLPGSPLPIYSAVTGEDTENELQRVKDNNENAIFIGLTTGNWVRIRRTSPRCPIPLSRGGRHPEFKQKLIDICDEIYVVAPLGKIFANMGQDEINKLLKLSEASNRLSKKSYKEPSINDEQAKIIKLVSTRRQNHRLLSQLSTYLSGQLQTKKDGGDNNEFQKAKIGDTYHLQFSFDGLPSEKYLEKEIEFPHSYTRNSKFINRFINP